MQTYVLFGLPGAGKTYVGKVFYKDFGFYFHEGDLSLPEAMRRAIQNKTPITESMTDDFFKEIREYIRKFKSKYDKVVIAQAFFREKYRKEFLRENPEARFILIETKTRIREKRLIKRTDYPLDLSYAREMYPYFETPSMDYEIIRNDSDNEEDVRRQIQTLLNSSLDL